MIFALANNSIYAAQNNNNNNNNNNFNIAVAADW